jgi:hypothetical protein
VGRDGPECESFLTVTLLREMTPEDKEDVAAPRALSRASLRRGRGGPGEAQGR